MQILPQHLVQIPFPLCIAKIVGIEIKLNVQIDDVLLF